MAFHSHLDQLFLAPGSVLTRTGDYLRVSSQFRRVCHERLYQAPPGVRPRPQLQPLHVLASDPLPDAVPAFPRPTDNLRRLWPAGEEVAQERLCDSANQHPADYHERCDFPVLPDISQLSPYPVVGVLSPRRCPDTALVASRSEFSGGQQSAVTWINELLRCEFYKRILADYPWVSRHRPSREETETLRWRQTPAELEAWQQGRIGIPIIDATMYQLSTIGRMYNRLWMVVAMFLNRNLLIDWREGERWFTCHSIDGDLVASNGGWQWSVSTGADAVPYFRLLNPLLQSERFDPRDGFIRYWLPELTGLKHKAIHDPPSLGLFAGVDYLRPMVDLKASRERALAAFRNLLPRDGRAQGASASYRLPSNGSFFP